MGEGGTATRRKTKGLLSVPRLFVCSGRKESSQEKRVSRTSRSVSGFPERPPTRMGEQCGSGWGLAKRRGRAKRGRNGCGRRDWRSVGSVERVERYREARPTRPKLQPARHPQTWGRNKRTQPQSQPPTASADKNAPTEGRDTALPCLLAATSRPELSEGGRRVGEAGAPTSHSRP